MTWPRAFLTYLRWLGAHAVAGAIFAVASFPLVSLVYSNPGFGIPLEGLLAGAAFGAAQWLVLRGLFAGMRSWAPVTLIASPMSWFSAWWLGMASIGFGGWIGATISATAQWAVFLTAFPRDLRLSGLSTLWIPGALVGSAGFYFDYVFFALPGSHNGQPNPTWVMLIVAGSLGYAIVTGLVVVLLAALRRQPKRVVDRASEV